MAHLLYLFFSVPICSQLSKEESLEPAEGSWCVSITKTKSASAKLERVCGICNKQFSTKDNLKRHMNKHLDTPKYHCTYCNQYFSSDELLQKHNSEKHEAQHLCPSCGQTFKTKNAAKKHAATQHLIFLDNPEEIFIYTCSFQDCGRRFVQRTRFLDHLNAHTGVKPHACSHCKKKFKDRYQKKGHEDICTGKVSAVCQHCGHRCTSRLNLKRHIDAKHSGRSFGCECGKVFSCRSALCRHKKNKKH